MEEIGKRLINGYNLHLAFVLLICLDNRAGLGENTKSFRK